MHLDKFMPDYEFHEIHTVTIQASPQRVFSAIKELTGADISPLVSLLMQVRNLPGRLTKRADFGSFQNGTFLEQMFKNGFIPLAEQPGREIVFGLVGQFWKPVLEKVPAIAGPQAFLAFDDPAYARVAANLFVDEVDGGVRCSTETRIHASDPSTRRKFALYWRIISMGSAVIRVLWLRAIKRKAEKMPGFFPA
jgi:hypothetical protein